MKRFLFLCLAVVSLVACSDDVGIEASLKLDSTSLAFSADGGEQSVTITSTDEWVAEFADGQYCDWCTITPVNSTQLKITIAANDATEGRKTSIVVSSGSLSNTIEVTQLQKNALVAAKDVYAIDNKGGTVEIAIGYNVEFTTDISVDWITMSSTRAYKTETVAFYVEENNTGGYREGFITFTSEDNALSQTVKIEQGVAMASNEIRVTLTSSSYLENLRTRVTNYLGDKVVDIIEVEDETYSIILTNDNIDIPDEMFSGFDWMKSVILGDNIISVGDFAFSGCEALENVIIGNGVISIGKSAFNSCRGLDNVIIGNSVISIGGYAFSGCSNLRNIIIPDSVTSIGDYAFQNCSNLEEVTISDGVTSIGANPFVDCRSLSVIDSKNVSADGRCWIVDGKLISFVGYGLTEYAIPNGVVSIGDSAFSHCSDLESIAIPDSVTSIGKSAFNSCSALGSITIPDSVTSIGDYAFQSCSYLGVVKLPVGITSIENYVFSLCPSLESITIPESVISIGECAFYDCSSLKSITLPNILQSIGNEAFYRSSLVNVAIPDSVKSIGESAFETCDYLESVIIGSGVESIGDRAFAWCDNLKSVYCKAIIPPSIGDLLFFESGEYYVTVYVPTESVEAYETWPCVVEGYDF